MVAVVSIVVAISLGVLLALSITRPLAKGVAFAASKEIGKDIAGVDQAASETAHGAAGIQVASQNLARMAEQLQTMVGQFKV